MTRPGQLLEGAVELAAREYERLGRGDIRKADAPSIVARGEKIFTGAGDSDYVGDADGRAFRGECKETHEVSLPLNNIKDHQLETLTKAAARGCTSGLIIAFLPAWLCWWLPIVELNQFLAVKWRESITIDMCKAWGVSLPVDCRPSVRKRGRFVRHVRFLDGVRAADADAATSRVNLERAKPLDLFGEGVLGPLEEEMPRRTPTLDRLLGQDPLSPASLRKFARKRGAKTGWWGK